MNLPWFKRSGIFFLPAKFFGWLILVAAIGLSIYEFIYIDGHSHSVSDTLMNWIFHCLLIWLIYSAIAFFACKNYGKD